MEDRIERVEAREIKGGFRYVAILDDGSEVVLRKKATRPYANAFMWTKGNRGNAKELAGHFSYGKAPSSCDLKYDTLIKTFPIKH